MLSAVKYYKEVEKTIKTGGGENRKQFKNLNIVAPNGANIHATYLAGRLCNGTPIFIYHIFFNDRVSDVSIGGHGEMGLLTAKRTQPLVAQISATGAKNLHEYNLT